MGPQLWETREVTKSGYHCHDFQKIYFLLIFKLDMSAHLSTGHRHQILWSWSYRVL